MVNYHNFTVNQADQAGCRLFMRGDCKGSTGGRVSAQMTLPFDLLEDVRSEVERLIAILAAAGAASKALCTPSRPEPRRRMC